MFEYFRPFLRWYFNNPTCEFFTLVVVIAGGAWAWFNSMFLIYLGFLGFFIAFLLLILFLSRR